MINIIRYQWKIESITRNQLNILSEAQARDLAGELNINGYQSVKIGSCISKPMYLAITMAVNHKEVAHIEEFSKALDNEFGGYNSKTADEYLQYVEQRSEEVARVFNQKGIAVGSTLWDIEWFPKQVLELQSIINNLDLSYGNPEQVAKWMPGEDHFEVKDDLTNAPDSAQRIEVFWNTYVEAFRIMLRAFIKHDVIILAETDTNFSLVIPGISIHHKLESLVNSGMSPAQTIRSATLIPGRWMDSNTGKIAVEYNADLILLSDNPLHDITNNQKIDTVIAAGKVLGKPKINSILQGVRVAYGATKSN